MVLPFEVNGSLYTIHQSDDGDGDDVDDDVCVRVILCVDCCVALYILDMLAIIA